MGLKSAHEALPSPHRTMRTGIRARLLFTRLLGLSALALVLATASRWSVYGPHWLGTSMFASGGVLAVVGFGGRVWALWHIGGRKKRELVRTGPYSACRHPLYLCSLIGGLGLVLCTQRLTMLALYLVACALLVPIAIRSEEAFLKENFDDYDDYRAGVPALFPRLSWTGSWKGVAVDGPALRRGLLETAGLLLPMVLMHVLAGAQRAGSTPFLLVLP